MNGNSSVNEDVKWMKIFLSKMMAVYMPATVLFLLNPWSRVLLENLTGSQLVKKFSAFYGTRRFINAFANARHLSLS
jgi:hypothetical protein